MRKHENSVIHIEINHEGRTLALECRFITSGRYPVRKTISYIHPTPGFNRLFTFASGGCEIRMDGLPPCTLTPGTVFLIPTGRTFGCTYRANSEFVYYHFELLDVFGLDLFWNSPPAILRLAAPELATEVITAYRRQNLEGLLRSQAAAFAAISRIAAPLLDKKKAMFARSAKCHKVLEHIRRNPRATLTVKELAATEGISRDALARHFRHAVGMPLKEYLTNMITRKALHLIGSTDLTIKEIAVELGFEDPLYFFRFFKKHVKQTPLEYRTAVAKGAYEPTGKTNRRTLLEGR